MLLNSLKPVLFSYFAATLLVHVTVFPQFLLLPNPILPLGKQKEIC